MDLVNTKAASGQTTENRMSVKYSAMNGTSTSQSDLKVQEAWEKVMVSSKHGKATALRTALVACTVSNQSTFHHEVGRDIQAPTPN